jgi:hypothetical protein
MKERKHSLTYSDFEHQEIQETGQIFVGLSECLFCVPVLQQYPHVRTQTHAHEVQVEVASKDIIIIVQCEKYFNFPMTCVSC